MEQIIDRVMKGMLRTTEERAKAVVGTWGAVHGWRCAPQVMPQAEHYPKERSGEDARRIHPVVMVNFHVDDHGETIEAEFLVGSGM